MYFKLKDKKIKELCIFVVILGICGVIEFVIYGIILLRKILFIYSCVGGGVVGVVMGIMNVKSYVMGGFGIFGIFNYINLIIGDMKGVYVIIIVIIVVIVVGFVLILFFWKDDVIVEIFKDDNG